MSPPGDDKQAYDSAALPADYKIHGPLRETNPQRAGLSLEAPTSLQQMGRWLTLLGHRDFKTTMIYTHVLNRGGTGVRSPAGLL